MRSRDGNRTFSLSISSLVLFFAITLNAKEYLISYQYMVKDATLYSETLDVSQAMTKCDGTPQKPLILDNYENDDLKKVITNNYDIFMDYVHKLGLDVNNDDLTISLQNTSSIKLTLKTTCFKVHFNDTFVRIIPLK